MHIHGFKQTMQSWMQIAVMILGQGTYYLTDFIFKLDILNSTIQVDIDLSIELHNGSYSQKSQRMKGEYQSGNLLHVSISG